MPHLLRDNDQVVYEQGDGGVVGGLTSGNVYVVETIDERTIKLKNPADLLAAPVEFSGTAISNDTITLPVDHGFVSGQPVTYRAPTPKEFSVRNVDVLGADAQGEVFLFDAGITSDDRIDDLNSEQIAIWLTAAFADSSLALSQVDTELIVSKRAANGN